MCSSIERPIRKNLSSHGMIYMGGEEQEITVINISTIGVLAELNSTQKNIDVKDIFSVLKVSTSVEIYLPDMRLAGESEVVRVDIDDGQVFLALIFKNIAFDIDKNLNQRKAYRKNLSDPGVILFEGTYHNFIAMNVSTEGSMVRLDKMLTIDEGTHILFEFKKLALKGEAEVVWSDIISDSETLIGLRYVNINNEALTGIPRFSMSIATS